MHPATAAQPLSRASEREAQKEEGERQERRADTAEEEEKEKQEEDEEGQEEEAESSSEPPPTLGAKSRTKRFVSEDRFVEMLLVADASMVAFYGEDLEVRLAVRGHPDHLPESPNCPLSCPSEKNPSSSSPQTRSSPF